MLLSVDETKCSIFNTVQNFALWASIGVACSYASRPFLYSLALVYTEFKLHVDFFLTLYSSHSLEFPGEGIKEWVRSTGTHCTKSPNTARLSPVMGRLPPSGVHALTYSVCVCVCVVCENKLMSTFIIFFSEQPEASHLIVVVYSG